MALLERDAELDGLGAALGDARLGRGVAAIVEGPAGIGKSTLLTALRRQARGEGLVVLRARGSELDRAFGFGVVRQLFEPVLAEAERPAELLEGPAGVAARLLALPGAEAAPDALLQAPADASFTVLHGLYWLTANLAARTPLLLAVDDAQWADAASLRYLGFLLPRLEELPVALVIASRPTADGAAADLLGELAIAPGARVLRPAPLSPAAVAGVVEQRLGPPDSAFAAACHQVTGGTPFLLEQLMTALAADRVAPDAASAERVERLASDTVARWILLRIASLPPAAARLARALAVLETAPPADAAALAGLGEAEAATAADALEAAGVLADGRPLAFAHPLVRQSVYGELPPAERSAAHRIAATLDTARVADHLLPTAPNGDGWVVEQLALAAGAATARGASDSARAYLRRALAEPPADAARAGVLMALGAAELAAGDPGGLERVEAAYAAATDTPTRVIATQILAGMHGWAQRWREAMAAIDRALAALGPEDDGVAVALEVTAITMARAGGLPPGEWAERAAALRERADADPAPGPELLAFAAWVATQASESADVGAALAARALAAAPGPIDTSSLGWFASAGSALVTAGRHEEAIRVLGEVAAQARAAADLPLLSFALVMRAQARFELGDLVGAEDDAGAARETGGWAPLSFGLLAASRMAWTLLEQGRVEESDAVLAPLAADGPSQGEAELRFTRALVQAARGRRAEALAGFSESGQAAMRTGAGGPTMPWRSQAALAGGDPALAHEELRLARAYGAPLPLGRALIAAGRVGAAEPLLREAVEVLAPTGHRLEHARALLALGEATRERDTLTAALELARACRATPLADRAHDALVAAGARPRRDPVSERRELSAAELRVARLAAEGGTNKQIAQALFVTEKTVEVHLTSSYRKLGIRSRAQLAGAL